LDRANALSSASEQVSYLAGPTLAGIVVALLGGPWALLFDALSFLLMGLLVFSLPVITRAPVEEHTMAKRDWLGFGPLFRIKEVRMLAILALIFFFSYGPLEAALPVYSEKILHAGAMGYGLLWSGFGVGALIGVLLISFWTTRFRPGIMLPLIAVLWGLFLCPLAIGHTLTIAVIFLALAAFSWAPYTPIETSLLQRLIPTHLRGQVFGARLALITAAAPLGAIVGGLLLEHFSPSVVIGISGVACIAAGIGGLLSPTMRHLQYE
jgi:MFS family permease